ncbi:metallophosphoesterase [Jeotgalibacillus sp. S-D1]|uniref:metallophosphoesterase n=1 Tax=Jeotgalibacillus sp. S-D1 TaxID=2552189 RepID=UPI001404D2C2|nr:metallophosphoesterase [Jeotgalibacillus sp. S-D1]
MKKIIILAVVSVSIICCIAYIYWDNNRLTIEEQTIQMDALPKAFEGFRILQITDLHEKEFGTGQTDLIRKINAQEYDAIVFTGDMLDDPQQSDYTAFFDLLDGIDNKENAYFVPGNTDPDSYVVQEQRGLEKSAFILQMEERGVLLLESVKTIQKEEDTIHFVNFDLASLNPEEGFKAVYGRVGRPVEKETAYLDYQNQMLEQFSKLNDADEEVLIALSHYPVVDEQMDYLDRFYALRKNMLILAGHYHGGQIRLPFIGAPFVPEAWYENGGLFPPRDRVSGLWEYKNTQQYVSAGLGSSDAVAFLKFRLFNPPQINLLTLENK